MAKLNNPLFGIEAHGSIGDTLTFQDRGKGTMVRRKPYPTDPKSLAQMYHRWDYQDGASYWNTLSDAVKRQWEIDARRARLTGFNLFMRTYLTTLPDLAARWRLDITTGTYTPDSSNNTNNATLFGPSHIKGIIDRGMVFDGLDDRLRALNHASLKFGTGSFSILAFFNKSVLGTPSYIVNKGQYTSGLYRPTYALRVITANKLSAYIEGSTAAEYLNLTGPTLLQADTWYHGALTRDGPNNLVTLYLNGEFEASGSPTTNADTDSNYDSYIGCWDRNIGLQRFWPGGLDHIEICNRCLSAEDVYRHSQRKY